MPRQNFRKIAQFQNDNDLQRELDALQNDTADAIESTAKQMWFRFKSTSLKTSDYRAKLFDQVRCGATMTVLLPTANKDNDGRAVAVLREAGTITVGSPSSNVQGAASESLTTNGLRVYVSNGEDWWRAP